MPNVQWRARARVFVAVLASAMTLGATAATAQTLQPGSRGDDVVALQEALGIPADGAYGPQTKRAVQRFQRIHGLVVDGIAGPATLSALGIEDTADRSTKGEDVDAVLESIARCESGGNPAAISSSGTYRGKYQFSVETWRSLGGKGDPAKASERRQDKLARKLYALAGATPWPNCA